LASTGLSCRTTASIEALPAAIDALPAIAAQIGNRATVLMDSGIRSGVDVGRALGAAAAFAGKAFLWGLGALGEAGPGHVIDLPVEELRATLGQVGAAIATVREVQVAIRARWGARASVGALVAGIERGEIGGLAASPIAGFRCAGTRAACHTSVALSVCLWHCQLGHAPGHGQTARLRIRPNRALYAADALTQRRSFMAVGAPVVELRQ
jgi:hypothetical protein